MADPDVYRRVITAIHGRRGYRFAMWEITREVGCSRSATALVIGRFLKIKWLWKYPRGFASRVYGHTKRWPERVNDAIEVYEGVVLTEGM